MLPKKSQFLDRDGCHIEKIFTLNVLCTWTQDVPCIAILRRRPICIGITVFTDLDISEARPTRSVIDRLPFLPICFILPRLFQTIFLSFKLRGALSDRDLAEAVTSCHFSRLFLVIWSLDFTPRDFHSLDINPR
jgi:hypothetical protein